MTSLVTVGDLHCSRFIAWYLYPRETVNHLLIQQKKWMHRLTTLGKEWEEAITSSWVTPSKHCAREHWAMYVHFIPTADLVRHLYFTSLYLRHFDVICDLLLNTRTVTWNSMFKNCCWLGAVPVSHFLTCLHSFLVFGRIIPLPF